MKKSFSKEQFNSILLELSKEYDIYAPVTLPFKGMFSDTDLIKYGKVNSLDEINFSKKSFYSAKETMIPMNQVLFHFNEKEFKEPALKEKKSLVFLRSCDLHSVKKLDNIYLNNKFADKYYSDAMKNIKYVVIGCKTGWDSCFCTSMGTNKTEEYNIGISFDEDNILVDIKDETFHENFSTGEICDFNMDFVETNKEILEIPENIKLTDVIDLPMWRDYDRCIACGRCNFVCPTCSCSTTQDVFYKDNENVGERRRVWASCHVDEFTSMAGGHEFRKKTGDRMRFKVMHKISDYKKRFGTHMCTGCGRCEDACPEYISYIECIKKLTVEVNKKKGDNNE